LFSELKRRNVFRVAAGYAVLSWLLLQVADVLQSTIGLPEVWGKAVLGLLIIGLVPALVISWVYEMTPEGLRRERDVAPGESVVAHTGRKLDIAIIVLLVIAFGVFALDRFVLAPDVPASISPVATTAAPKSGIPVVAVLPLQALSKEEEGQFLASGLHDDLLTRLARLKSFRVISRTSVMEYVGTVKSAREIGAELGADYIFEGGLQAIGGNVRINAQLIDAANDEHVWAETFDRELTTANLFQVQGEIAGAIADAMHATLSPQEVRQVSAIPTQNLEAYKAYLRGEENEDGLTQASLRAAVAAYREATELDPTFVEAWSGLTLVLVRQYWQEGAEDDAAPDMALREAAGDALDRAKALAPDDASTLRADAYYHYYGFRDYSMALTILDRAESIAPNDSSVIALRAWLIRRLGRMDEAADTLVRAREFDPNNLTLQAELIDTLVYAERCAEARDLSKEALGRHPDIADVALASAWTRLSCQQDAAGARDLVLRSEATTHFQLRAAVRILIYAGDYTAAIGVLTRARDTWVDRAPVHLQVETLLAWLYRQTGQDALADAALQSADTIARSMSDRGAMALRALALLAALHGDPAATLAAGQRAIASLPDDEYMYTASALQIMHAYVIAGLNDEALDVLEDSLTNHYFANAGSLVLDPILKPITGTARFEALASASK
jgi:TolB-like protein